MSKHSSLRTLAIAAAIVSLPAIAATAQTSKQTIGSAGAGTAGDKASKTDRQFLEKSIQGDLAEVQVGKLAEQKSDNADVKKFGQMLEQDHGQHLQKVQALAGQVGVTAPTQPSPQQKRTYDRLSRLSGARFDKSFATAMVDDHKRDIREYQKEAKTKSAVGDMAGQTVPTLEKHLQTAESLTSKK